MAVFNKCVLFYNWMIKESKQCYKVVIRHDKCCIALCCYMVRIVMITVVKKERALNIQKKEINIQIGKRLQTARENNGYTQELFAEALDVGVEHYRKIEGGLYGLQPEKMLILYEKYKIEPTYLVIGELNHNVDIELYLANCSREDRNIFLERVLIYMKKLMVGN